MIKSVIFLSLFFNTACTSSNNEFIIKNKTTKELPTPEFVNEKDIDLNLSNDTLSNKVEEDSFIKYFNKIPVLEVGYVASCYDSNFKTERIESDFSPSEAPVLGKLLSINNDYYSIIYVYEADIPLPILEIYNIEGEKLKEFQLFNYGFCTDLFNDNQSSSFEILSNERIVLTSFIENKDSLEIVKSDTINLVNEISLFDK
jgi:hypothetical protein